MNKYKVEKTEQLVLNCSSPLSGMFKLSPYVWKEKSGYRILIRAVNPSEDATQKVARIYAGYSKDGLTFKMNDGPAIAPGMNNLDKDGCEDPTVVIENNLYFVYYTGWNQTKMEGQLLLAQGKHIEQLSLTGIAIKSKKPYINPKEATVTQLKNGLWILLFEYADDNRSKLGTAISKHPEGPWKIKGEWLPAIKDSWDSYHLSPGPVIIDQHKQSVLFYNGSNEKAHWRIGCAAMDEDGNITNRSKQPLITPPKGKKGDTNIAFAASAVLHKKHIWLYYTVADHTTYRAVISVTDK